MSQLPHLPQYTQNGVSSFQARMIQAFVDEDHRFREILRESMRTGIVPSFTVARNPAADNRIEICADFSRPSRLFIPQEVQPEHKEPMPPPNPVVAAQMTPAPTPAPAPAPAPAPPTQPPR